MTTAKDGIGEFCSIDGLGNIFLGGALGGAKPFMSAYDNGVDQIPVKVELLDSNYAVIAWERVRCTYVTAGNQLVRGDVMESSNGGSLVNFGPGTKRAFVYLPVDDVGTASGLRTATTVVSVSAATAPSAGQTLVATSSTAATWQTPASGGISAADLAGGTLPASLTTLATSGVATLAGLTVSSPTYPLWSITYEADSASLTCIYNTQPRAQYGASGTNFTSEAVMTWSSTYYNHAVDRDLQVARNGVNRMGLGSYGVWNDAALELGAVRKKPYTVGTLPVAPSAYDQCLVVDALAPAIGSAVVGGGGVAANVIWISPNWMVI